MSATPRIARRAGNTPEYRYREIAADLRAAIRAGRHKPGTRLPSLDQLARQYDVNRLTVLRALNSLKQAGFVYAVPAQGTYVCETIPAADAAARPRASLRIALVSQVLLRGRIGAYHADIINGIQEALAPVRGHLSLVPLLQVDRARDVLRLAFQDRPDGVIYLGPFGEDVLRHLVENGPPSVLADYQLPRSPADSIVVDNRGGGARIMDHLLDLGHRRFAVITGPEDQPASPERLAGLRAAAQARGLPPAGLALVPGSFTRESGMEAMRRILRKHPRATAVVCMNDEMAAGALQAIHAESDLRVPGDFSVTGFDNLEIAGATHPPMTTVHIDRHNLGRLAAQRLLERLGRGAGAAVTISLQTELVVRASTGAPRR